MSFSRNHISEVSLSLAQYLHNSRRQDSSLNYKIKFKDLQTNISADCRQNS